MSVWRTRPVDEVPSIVLENWRVMELDDGDRHFVGYNVTEGSGRVSSKIETFDKETMRGTTRSGRVYELRGPTGWDSDAAYVWANWLALNSLGPERYKDVSEEL